MRLCGWRRKLTNHPEANRTMDTVWQLPPQVGIGYEAFWLRDYAYTLEGSVDFIQTRN